MDYIYKVRQKEWIDFKRPLHRDGGDVEWGGDENAGSVVNVEWSGAQRAFVVDVFEN
jgi:hypothetical protein